MNYHLSNSDVKVLKQTINTVDNLAKIVPQGKRPIIKNAFAYAELIEEDTNGLWSAKEVYFDETGTPNELTDGRTWGGDNPSVIINGKVSAGQVVRIEAYYLVDSSDEEQAVWVGSAIGGGETYRLSCLSGGASIGYGGTSDNFSLLDNNDNVIESNIIVTQRKYQSAIFFEDEILYAQADELGYDLSPFLSGVGIGNA